MSPISGKTIQTIAKVVGIAVGVTVTTAVVAKAIDTKSIFAGSSKSETAAQRNGRLGSEEAQFQKEIVDAWNEEHSYLFGLIRRHQKDDIDKIQSEDTWRLIDKALQKKLDSGQKLTEAETLYWVQLQNSKKYHKTDKPYDKMGRCFIAQEKSALNGKDDKELAALIAEYSKDPKTRGAKMKALMESCSIADRNRLNLYQLERMKEEGYDNKYLAEMGAVYVIDKGELQLTQANKVKQGFKENKLSEDDVFELRNKSVASFDRKYRAKIVNIYDQTGIKKVYEQTVADTKNGLFDKDEQREIWEDKVKNANLYSAETRNYFAQNIGVTDKSIQLDLNSQYTSYAVQHGDTELLKSIAKGVASYAEQNYEAAYKVVIDAAKVLDVPKAVVDRIIKEAGISGQISAETPNSAATMANSPSKPNNQAVTNPFASPAQAAKTNETKTADENPSQPPQTAEEIARALAKGNFAQLDRYLSNAPKHIKEQIYAMLERSPVLFKLYVDAHKDDIFKNPDISSKLKDEAAVWLINRPGNMAAAEYISKNTFSKYYKDKAKEILPSAA